jgi:heme exporter protein CcmD
MSDFFYMSGYGFYVWTAYAIVLIAMTVNFIWPAIQQRRLIEKLRQAQIRKAKLARRRQA